MDSDQLPAPPTLPAGAHPLPRPTAQAEPVIELDDENDDEAALMRPKKRGRPPSPFSKFFIIGRDEATMQSISCLVVLSHQTSRYEAHLNKCSTFRAKCLNAFKALSGMSCSSHQSVAVAGLGGSSSTADTPGSQASVRVLDGLSEAGPVRKAYKIVEARMTYRMIV
jgi:hypothetical protein